MLVHLQNVFIVIATFSKIDNFLYSFAVFSEFVWATAGLFNVTYHCSYHNAR